jgi:hypothetical protein
MASEVDICNLALAHLGDRATGASLNPPEGSVQAEHCARFYPMARDTLLEMHSWNFAVKRVALAETGTAPGLWQFSYARPTNALAILSILAPEDDDTREPHKFVCETSTSGSGLIYTDVEDATALYVSRVEDPTKFSPLFTQTLSWHLASMLAGPVIKGDAGAAEAKRCIQMMAHFLAKATVSDANQREIRPTHSPSWISGR